MEDDQIHLSGLSASGCAWYAWKFLLDHWFEVEQEVSLVVEVVVALEYDVVVLVELEAVKFPAVCDYALILQLGGIRIPPSATSASKTASTAST